MCGMYITQYTCMALQLWVSLLQIKKYITADWMEQHEEGSPWVNRESRELGDMASLISRTSESGHLKCDRHSNKTCLYLPNPDSDNLLKKRTV